MKPDDPSPITHSDLHIDRLRGRVREKSIDPDHLIDSRGCNKDVFDGYYKLVDLQTQDYTSGKKRNSGKARFNTKSKNPKE